ncbi:enoyl-CoA hydratase/isomerase family protein [Natrinema caseinilyticum]|uniref:enoyl-CoA hydratase/isomerase family protein n=1 Tax=Natrinema caseinilyticum TaxID=2961570 RepID=UPI0020C361FF|nr:enoyl-CoA hydratase/isomerase family protein [Natrinema caseinilyticum]
MSEKVLLDVSDGIATLTINNPDKRNAMDQETRSALRDRVDEVDANDEIRVVVLRGEGDSYITGGDIEAFADYDQVDALEYLTNYGQGLYNDVAELTKPTIAAIDGYAFGGGLEISLACDLRVATPDATIGLTEVGLGIIPGGGGTQRLAHVAGAGVAKDLIFTGRAVDAEEAADLGIVNRVYDAEEFDESVRELAETIAANAPMALRLAKKSINRGLDAEAGLDFERIACSFLFGTADKQEGAEAFLEKRDPNFEGR